MNHEHLRAFIATVQHEGFAPAARALGVAPSTVSRACAGLEDEIGTRLLHRTTRRMQPTEAGLRFFERVVPLVLGLDDARAEAVDQRRRPAGHLRVSVPVSYAQLRIVPRLAEFARRHPEIRVSLDLSDRRVDLLAERFDLAVRLGQLADSSLVARRLHAMRYVLCASPDYLHRAPALRRPGDVAQHPCLVFPLPRYGAVWRFRKSHETQVRLTPTLTISNTLALRDCAVAGMGLTVLADWVVEAEVARGALVPLLTEYQVTGSEFEASAWLLQPTRAYVPAKVRAFETFLEERLSPSR